jgi:hypothetical protein
MPAMSLYRILSCASHKQQIFPQTKRNRKESIHPSLYKQQQNVWEHVIFTHCERCRHGIRADPQPRPCPPVLRAGKEIGFCGITAMSGERVYYGLCPSAWPSKTRKTERHWLSSIGGGGCGISTVDGDALSMVLLRYEVDLDE